MRDFLRVLLMNVADVLDEHLVDDRLKGLLAFDAVLGSHLGPRSPTSLLGLYYRLAGETRRHAGAQIAADRRHGRGRSPRSRAAAEKAGVTIRTGAPVGQILVEKGRATGVALADGEEICGRHGRLGRQPAHDLPRSRRPARSRHGFVRNVGNIRMKGDAAKLHLALDRVPHSSACRRAPQGPAGHRAVDRPCRARLQPVEIRRVLARTGDGDHAAQPRRSDRSRPPAPASCRRSCSMRPMR